MTAAAALGLATYSGDTLLDAWYPNPVLAATPADVPDLDHAARHDDLRDVRVAVISTVIPDLDAPPTDAADVYLRLHLLSHRLVQPRSINLTGVFGLLANVAWTSLGPVALDQIEHAGVSCARYVEGSQGQQSRHVG